MAIPRMKSSDVFAVSVVDDNRSQVVCPLGIREDFMSYLQRNGIDCLLREGEVKIDDVNQLVNVIVATASVVGVLKLFQDYLES